MANSYFCRKNRTLAGENDIKGRCTTYTLRNENGSDEGELNLNDAGWLHETSVWNDSVCRRGDCEE